MSLQLPAILSPPTPCIPSPALTVSPLERSPKLPCPLRVGVRFWASLTLRKLANASGRIVFNIALFMDWQFISGCLPPRLSTTQFPSTTDSQCSVRWGLPPHYWCALSGARRVALPRDRPCTFNPNSEVRTRPRPPHEHRVDLADSEELGMFSFFGDFGLEKVGFFQVVAPAPADCFGRRIMQSVAAWARKYWILVAWYLAS